MGTYHYCKLWVCKGKGDPWETANYRGLKIIDQILKIAEKFIEKLIRQQVDIDGMQFGFIPGFETINTIFTARKVLSICRLWSIASGCCMVGFEETRCRGVVC